jgi:hypothetical protein
MYRSWITNVDNIGCANSVVVVSTLALYCNRGKESKCPALLCSLLSASFPCFSTLVVVTDEVVLIRGGEVCVGSGCGRRATNAMDGVTVMYSFFRETVKIDCYVLCVLYNSDMCGKSQVH